MEEDGSGVETWACLSSADLEADLEESVDVSDLGSFASVFASLDSEALAVRLQKLCADVELFQFNQAALVSSLGITEAVPLAQALPPSLSLPWPSGAHDVLDYEQRLRALPSCLALVGSLRLETDARQDEKDLNRDVLSVNGQQIVGHEGGYQQALKVVEALKPGGAPILSALNRTTSGFAAFQEVLRLLDSPYVVISPESAKARPLEAAITGQVAMGRAHTRYAVHLADASRRMATVDAFVCFRMASVTQELPCSILLYCSMA